MSINARRQKGQQEEGPVHIYEVTQPCPDRPVRQAALDPPLSPSLKTDSKATPPPRCSLLMIISGIYLYKYWGIQKYQSKWSYSLRNNLANLMIHAQTLKIVDTSALKTTDSLLYQYLSYQRLSTGTTSFIPMSRPHTNVYKTSSFIPTSFPHTYHQLSLTQTSFPYINVYQRLSFIPTSLS